jgi:hypothetical protein
LASQVPRKARIMSGLLSYSCLGVNVVSMGV